MAAIGPPIVGDDFHAHERQRHSQPGDNGTPPSCVFITPKTITSIQLWLAVPFIWGLRARYEHFKPVAKRPDYKIWIYEKRK
jgi:hypothetical protein